MESSETNNVMAFPVRHDLRKVEQFAQSYADELKEANPEHRPKLVVVVEYFYSKEHEATVYDVRCGGEDEPSIHTLVGILEMAKQKAIHDSLVELK